MLDYALTGSLKNRSHVSTFSPPSSDLPMPAPACCRQGPGTICSTGSAPASRWRWTIWQQRLAQGRGARSPAPALPPAAPTGPGCKFYHFREVQRAAGPHREQILHQDDHLLVADKPPFLPVIPSGGYVEQTLAIRLSRRWAIQLQPPHRLIATPAALVLFSVNREKPGRYQALFRDHLIHKLAEALIAPAAAGIPGGSRPRIERE